MLLVAIISVLSFGMYGMYIFILTLFVFIID